MIAEIEAAKKDGDTLGGIVEVVVHGLPVGLGSFTSGDNRLDSQLAGAVMGIQAIKGVEIGDGFETARRRGSVAHDEMYPGADGVMRSTNRAGGLEGGMTNGQPLRVRAAMKPISTVPRALATVDMATGDEAVAIHQRSDVCAVPAAGVVVETMVALVLARAALEKFGGDSLTETRANIDSYLRSVAEREPSIAAGTGVGLMAPKAVLVGLPGSGKSTIGRRLAKALDLPLLDTDAEIEETTGRTIADMFAADGEAGVPPHRGGRRARPRWPSTTACCRSAAARSPPPGVREALAGHTVIYPRDQRGRRHPAHQRRHRAAAAGRRGPRREVQRADARNGFRCTGGSRRCGSTPTAAIPARWCATSSTGSRTPTRRATAAAPPSSRGVAHRRTLTAAPTHRGAAVPADSGGHETRRGTMS